MAILSGKSQHGSEMTSIHSKVNTSISYHFPPPLRSPPCDHHVISPHDPVGTDSTMCTIASRGLCFCRRFISLYDALQYCLCTVFLVCDFRKCSPLYASPKCSYPVSLLSASLPESLPPAFTLGSHSLLTFPSLLLAVTQRRKDLSHLCI